MKRVQAILAEGVLTASTHRQMIIALIIEDRGLASEEKNFNLIAFVSTTELPRTPENVIHGFQCVLQG